MEIVYIASTVSLIRFFGILEFEIYSVTSCQTYGSLMINPACLKCPLALFFLLLTTLIDYSKKLSKPCSGFSYKYTSFV